MPTNLSFIPYVYSKRRRNAKHSRDGGGKQHNVRTRFATVGCRVHGRSTVKGNDLPELRVSIPATKRQHYELGCPECAKERRIAARK